jgi:hypothetical protein
MRVEGNEWRAYYALTDTMKDALFLGSIKMRFVQTEERKAAFMGLMQESVGDVIEEKLGTRPNWHRPKDAPFWEKKE